MAAGMVTAMFCLGALAGCASGAAPVRPGDMPSGGTFTGVWFSPEYGEMHMVQDGATVLGRYEKHERRGNISGGAEGDLMRFEWTEKREMLSGQRKLMRGRGYFRLVKDADEDLFRLKGEWGIDEKETGGGPWTAVHSKRRSPRLYESSGGGEDVSGPDNSNTEDNDLGSAPESGGDEDDEMGDLEDI